MESNKKGFIFFILGLIFIFGTFFGKYIFLNKPTFFLSLELIKNIDIFIKSGLLFSIFFGISVAMISVMLNIDFKYKALTILITFIPFILFFKSVVGMSFASGFFVAVFLILMFPPKLIKDNYRSLVASLQMYNKNIIWKSLSFMFLFFVLFSIVKHANYLDPLLDTIDLTKFDFITEKFGKQLIANVLSEQAGTQINPEDLSDEAVKGALEQMKEMSDDIKNQVKEIIKNIPGINLIITLVVGGSIWAILSLIFLLSNFIAFITVMIVANFLKEKKEEGKLKENNAENKNNEEEKSESNNNQNDDSKSDSNNQEIYTTITTQENTTLNTTSVPEQLDNQNSSNSLSQTQQQDELSTISNMFPKQE